MATAPAIDALFSNAEALLPLLTTYQLAPQLVREQTIDRGIDQWERASNTTLESTPDEIATARQRFFQQQHATSDAEQQAWLAQQGLTLENITAIVARKLRLQKFKQAMWGSKLESYFLKRKRQLDQVVYSLIRTKDAALAQELYFRLEAGEQSFVELAQQYSQGPEAHTGGFVGPVEVGTLPPQLVQVLSTSQPGQLWAPRPLSGWFVVIRMERCISVQLNDFMRQRLLNELFENWVKEQLRQRSMPQASADEIPADTIAPKGELPRNAGSPAVPDSDDGVAAA